VSSLSGLIGHAEDDLAVRNPPSHHVDYLSHNWDEEDIWPSWKLIMSTQNDYASGVRLENAAWRAWIKAKYKLNTILPVELNWLVASGFWECPY
jgi:hypothetical protein